MLYVPDSNYYDIAVYNPKFVLAGEILCDARFVEAII